MKHEERLQKEFLLRKQEADARWDRIYKEALAGNIDKVAIICAMEQCNSADKAWLHVNRKIKNGI